MLVLISSVPDLRRRARALSPTMVTLQSVLCCESTFRITLENTQKGKTLTRSADHMKENYIQGKHVVKQEWRKPGGTQGTENVPR